MMFQSTIKTFCKKLLNFENKTVSNKERLPKRLKTIKRQSHTIVKHTEADVDSEKINPVQYTLFSCSDRLFDNYHIHYVFQNHETQNAGTNSIAQASPLGIKKIIETVSITNTYN